jgi:peptidoglycan-N-acetylglucosamine deacetylase
MTATFIPTPPSYDTAAVHEPPRVALTFDTEHPDKPTAPGGEGAILAALAAAGVRATFFLQGRWVMAQPELARRIHEAGHAIGNHSHHHAPMPILSDDGLRRDVRAAEDAIVAATGVDPRPRFRCPFGEGADDERVLRILAELGYRDHRWDVDPEDWNPRSDAAHVERTVVEGALAGGDLRVVLLHGWPEATARALPAILERLTAAGARFVALDEEPLG